MKVLLTNDDGIDSPGLVALSRRLAEVAEVAVVAPADNQSAVGRGITLRRDLDVDERQVPGATVAFAVTGTPVDCVRIAVLGPVAWRTPPLHYGPWELVTSLLTEGLVARGVDVTLFATLDSLTTARLDGLLPQGYADRPDVDGRIWEALHVSHALARSSEFDLVHNHLDWLPLAFADHCRAPMVTTVHGFSGPGILPAYVRAASSYVVPAIAATLPSRVPLAGAAGSAGVAALVRRRRRARGRSGWRWVTPGPPCSAIRRRPGPGSRSAAPR